MTQNWKRNKFAVTSTGVKLKTLADVRAMVAARKLAAATGGKIQSIRTAIAKKPFITPKTPAIISQQIGKTKRILVLIIGGIVAAYIIFKKVLK